LCNLLKKYGLGVQTIPSEQITVEADWFSRI